MLHDVDGQWHEVAVPDVGNITSISMDAPNDGWAAGENGLLHYHDGTWTAVLQ